MEAAYSSATSYTDSGVATVEHLTDDGSWTERRPFATAFVRGVGFRFEFWANTVPEPFASKDDSAPPPQHYVVWSDGVEVRSWWSIRPAVERHATIERALGGPTGISVGSAARVPGLLMPEMHWGSLLEDLTEARLLGEVTVDGAGCDKLIATIRSSGDSRTLWIDRESHLIRRVEWTLASGGHAVATIEPSLNVDVPPVTFTFDPDVAMADRGD